MMDENALNITNLGFGYGKADVIKNVGLSVSRGEFVGIIGPNGSGKSTLIKLMTGFLKPREGKVSLFGRDLKKINRRQGAKIAAVVPQELNFHFPYKVEDFVLMGRHPYQGLARTETDEDRKITRTAMKETGVHHLRGRSVLELSGGEKQRVILAASLAQSTRLLFLDEPTSSLDLHYQIEIYSILKQMNRASGLTVVAVTHDLNLGALFCERLVLLADGKISADGPPEDIITPDTISRYFNVNVECGLRRDSKTPFVIPVGRKS